MANDSRTEPAYGHSNIDTSYVDNDHILHWWTKSHDDLIIKAIEQKYWNWEDKICEDIIKITPEDTLSKWKSIDPICKEFSWYNVLVYFSIARSKVQGYDKLIPEPKWKICPLCNQKFIENSLSYPLVHRLGYKNLDFCSICLIRFIYPNTGNPKMGRNDIIEYVKQLTDVIERIPPQGFGEGQNDFEDFNYEERVKIFKILQNKPTTNRVKEVFGSWLNALINAEVLEDSIRKTPRGTQCIAKDGHVCYSLGEKTIDDILYFLKIEHLKEPRYPESNYRADFKVGETLIEYFGLSGNTDYDNKSKEKKNICKNFNINLISIYPKDLLNVQRLKEKLTKEIF